MQRNQSQARTAFEARIASDGISSSRWDETVHWKFTEAEIERLYEAAKEAYQLGLAAVERIVSTRTWGLFGIDEATGREIARSWQNRSKEIDVATRATFGWDGGAGGPKLLGFQADSTDGIVEASLGQWWWKEALFGSSDQFNTLHETLVARMGEALVPRMKAMSASGVHLAYMPDDEAGEGQMGYLAKVLEEAGVSTRLIALPDVGREDATGRFVDTEMEEIRVLLKTHPWQWLIEDPFGGDLLRACAGERLEVVEPAWKLLLTNRAIMQTLWEMYPFHPLLAETHGAASGFGWDQSAIARPKFGAGGLAARRGDVTGGRFVSGAAMDAEAAEGEILQAIVPMAEAGARFDVWIVGDEPCGMGVREDRDGDEVVVPHRFKA
jgi:glutathionylspermidine synthase